MAPLRLAVATAGFCLLLSAAQAEPTQYPLNVGNCGHTLTFPAAPRNVVTIGQSVTEILYALGVGDHMAGTSLWFNDVLPAFKTQNDQVPRLDNNAPSFESVINKRPGLVATQFEWMIGPQGVVGTREQFHKLGVPTYIMPSDCEGKNNQVGADGTRTAPFTTDTLYKGITQLAQIFDRQDRGAELVADLRRREATAITRARALGLTDASAVFWFSSADLDLDPYVAGRKGIPAYMMGTLGLRNVVQSDEEWPTVGWETIARANPSVIVIARMDRRRFPADDYERKLAFLRTDPVTKEMAAVKGNRIVILDAHAMQATIRLVSGLETLTEAMARLRQ
ncbi:ABC transporter substrate-binding protein [Rhodovastum atsumiense]|uniref:ABC transporter substrate-binding protein n=1 Tax=Rhodovastum atsumiense TaxID=504468 RepID=A0A5M6IW31_9PROT|nr:ABC transporter substrate-binding protein [Rhodovastum atsumiense]KAA5612543.1 ABC transporter substrate-binding protein [Rhodovastum atsumiense]CAH2601375.1 ABC transporter substrate-binding protein [Rhodovastum atsumiense]